MLIGISFVCADESSISIIKNNEANNIRKIGYELCKIYTFKRKEFLEIFRDYIWGITPEEAAANELMKDANLLKDIFSGKISDNQTINELKEGCFDYMAERLLWHYFELKRTLNNIICHKNEDIEKLKLMGYKLYDGVDSEAGNCVRILGELRNEMQNVIMARLEGKLIRYLSLTDRLNEFQKFLEQQNNIQIDEEIEL